MEEELNRYKNLVDEIVRTLEDLEATYGEAFEALEGAKRRLNHKLNEVRIDL